MLNFLPNLSNLKSDFTQTLGYLNPASGNLALVCPPLIHLATVVPRVYNAIQ